MKSFEFVTFMRVDGTWACYPNISIHHCVKFLCNGKTEREVFIACINLLPYIVYSNKMFDL